LQEKVDLGAIKAFVAVAQAGGFSSGARAVGLTRSAVGKALVRLEERLGTRLLHRTTRSVALTADGQAFYERCRQILTDLEEAEAEVRQNSPEPRGLLRLTVPDSFGRQHVLPILSGYLKAWPALAAEVSITDRVADLVEEGYDLAVRCGGPLPDTHLIARVIARSHAVLCAAPAYLANRGEPLAADDLLPHSRITLGDRNGTRPWLLMPPIVTPCALPMRGGCTWIAEKRCDRPRWPVSASPTCRLFWSAPTSQQDVSAFFLLTMEPKR
jgi:DNA-binding transcriptional LysR family regulator